MGCVLVGPGIRCCTRYTHVFTLTHSLSLTHALPLAHSLSPTHSQSDVVPDTCMSSLSLTHCHSRTHCHSLTHYHPLTHNPMLCSIHACLQRMVPEQPAWVLHFHVQQCRWVLCRRGVMCAVAVCCVLWCCGVVVRWWWCAGGGVCWWRCVLVAVYAGDGVCWWRCVLVAVCAGGGVCWWRCVLWRCAVADDPLTIHRHHTGTTLAKYHTLAAGCCWCGPRAASPRSRSTTVSSRPGSPTSRCVRYGCVGGWVWVMCG